MNIDIENDWNAMLKYEFKKKYFKNIIEQYNDSAKLADTVNLKIFPHQENIFNAFNLTPFNKLKVCIIGQDPYHSVCKKTGIPYANGLAFSVNKGCSIPRSLNNIFKELSNDLNIKNGQYGDKEVEETEPKTFDVEPNGDLSYWAEQGVFLINTQLSVIENNSNSHLFWKRFTDIVIKYISDNLQNVIFVCWGRNALQKMDLVDSNKHIIFASSHPSPLGAYRTMSKYSSFIGSKIFSRINNKLKELELEPIDWKL